MKGVAMPDQAQAINVSLEGISGCGKSYILSKLRERLADLPVTFIEEVEDRESRGLDQGIIALFKKHADCFFRSGHPQTETLLLMALKAYDAEVNVTPALAAGHIVIEDRSIDSVAVYQAVILHPGEETRQLEAAHRIYHATCQWRMAPHMTFLIQDDFATSIERAQRRIAHTFAPNELALLREIAALYDRYALCYQERIICLDRRHMDVDDIVQTIRKTVITHGM
jgi:dTMP kinase